MAERAGAVDLQPTPFAEPDRVGVTLDDDARDALHAAVAREGGESVVEATADPSTAMLRKDPDETKVIRDSSLIGPQPVAAGADGGVVDPGDQVEGCRVGGPLGAKAGEGQWSGVDRVPDGQPRLQLGVGRHGADRRVHRAAW